MIKLLPNALRNLHRDVLVLFLTRFTRLFAYGSLSVILVFYLVGLGLKEAEVGMLLTLILVGDIVVSLVGAGLAFASTKNLLFLIIAGTIGVISPSGNEVGPFLPIEQAALSQVVPNKARTEVFAWYQLAGSVATALGALGGGGVVQLLQRVSVPALQSYRVVVILYAVLGLVLVSLFTRMSS